MEEVGTQLAAPLFIHQNIVGRFCEGGLIGKKRNLHFSSSNQLQHAQNERAANGWNPKEWEWDSARFAAKSKPPETGLLRLGMPNVACMDTDQEGVDLGSRAPAATRSNNSHDENGQDGNGLQLQLGGAKGTSTSQTDGSNVQNSISTDEPGTSSRPNKKGRSGSPGNGGAGGGNYPMCQVDNCTEDLSKSKDYHRRHKVCELHSKATKALVGKQMQRFCQQCSRFHPLSEFDEGKRSCRRRLAGHNRRRRKTQPEDATSPVMHPNNNNAANGHLDIVNLLTVLARGQGNAERNFPTSPSLPDQNHLIQILSKINSVARPTDAPIGPAFPTGSDKNGFEQAAWSQNNVNVHPAVRSNADFLTVLSATLAASAPDALALFSQRNAPGAHMNKNKTSSGDKGTNSDLCDKPATELHSLGVERSSSSYPSPTQDSDGQVLDTRINLPLQLFSPSPGDDSPPNMVSSGKYFSSDSCSPPEERSHSSVPITRKLFPLETTSEYVKPDRMSVCEEDDIQAEVSRTETFASGMTLELYSFGNRAVNNTSQSLPHQAGYTSSSGSDHSPPSFNSDPQKDRTGRIMFKLFDKDPSHFPEDLRYQIYNWLSNSPSEMESFIRPGCVVLSIYLSMSSAGWEKLEENFPQQVSSLFQGADSDFWRNGRFSVNIGRQLAFHNNGKLHVCKPWSALNSPELFVVSPLAVVSGQETSLVIKGRNLTSPGTKIHCTYMGGYSSKEVYGSAHQGFTFDEVILTDFKVPGAASFLGRCFIEVENGVRGNSFPIIIADAEICRELRLLEREFDEEAKMYDVVNDDQAQNITSPGSHEEVLRFLNELGWLFQRQMSPAIANHDYVLHRFQYLLTFSIERDYCVLVKTLLDIFVERASRIDGPSRDRTEEALAKMHLLHRAVKKRSKKMVDMLIHYSIPHVNGISRLFIFPPNLRGPGGITPLHLAACTSGSYDIVDVLTNDPTEIGLQSWKSLVDDNEQSPYAYALMRNDRALNDFVARKLVDRRNCQVSVSIGSEIVVSSGPAESRQRSSLQVNKKQNSCSKCAMRTFSRMPTSQGFLHKPFVHSMLGIAAVCVCVCLFFKSMSGYPMWENLGYGAM